MLGAAAVAASGVLVAAVAAPAGAATEPTSAPLLKAPTTVAAPGRYIVVLDGSPAASSSSAAAAFRGNVAQAEDLGVTVKHEYTAVLNGYSASLTADQLSEVRKLPGVAYVSEDRLTQPPATQTPTPSWGLDRIDQHNLPLNNAFSYDNAAPNVVAYMLDTGVRATHTEFAGRVLPGYNVVTTDPAGQASTNTNDCNGHGTYIAGIFAGTTYGVAKQAKMVPVRVYGCGGGYGSDWIAGINWITSDHAANPTRKLALAEIQSSGPDAALDSAIQSSINAGVTWVSAAGNSGLDSCTVSIDDVPANIVVGASNNTDQAAGFSQYGACLDLYAPGVDITSSSYLGDTATTTASGTSPAAPHVLGVAAQYVYVNPAATPAQVQTALVNGATTGALTSLPAGSPNKLIYDHWNEAPPTPTFVVQAANLAPTATTDNMIRPDLRLRATGTVAIDLSKVTLRYWFTRDGGASTFTCAKVTQNVVNISPARTGADAYLQVGFTTAAGSISGTTNTGQIQLRVNKTDWSNFSETADYSFRNTATVADFTKVTGYYNGALVYGTEP
jgi:hypothetical protein